MGDRLNAMKCKTSDYIAKKNRETSRKLNTCFNTQTHARSHPDYWLRIPFGDVKTMFDRPYVCLHVFNAFEFISNAFKPNTIHTLIQSGMQNTFRSNYYFVSYPRHLDFNTRLTKQESKKIENHDWVLKPNTVNQFQISNKMKWNGMYCVCIRAHTTHTICSITTQQNMTEFDIFSLTKHE